MNMAKTLGIFSLMTSFLRFLDNELKKFKAESEDLTIQMIFLDGEEAFVQWTDTDSIYGARHLAEKWHNTPYSFDYSETNVLGKFKQFF